MLGIFGERYALKGVVFDARVGVIREVGLTWLSCGGFQKWREISCGFSSSLVVSL